MDTNKEIIQISPKEIKELALENVVPGITSVLKKIASGNGGDLVQAASNAVQNSAKVGWLSSLDNEWKKLVEDGKVQPNFGSTETGRACLQELLDSLNRDLPDKRRFDAMKKLFIKAAKPEANEAEQTRLYQLMSVCRQLDGTEILVLRASFDQRKKIVSDPRLEITSADAWAVAVSKASNDLLSPGLVEHYEEKLIAKNIIGGRVHVDKSGIANSRNFRLSRLAIELGNVLEEPDA